jgi:phage terminase large subunit
MALGLNHTQLIRQAHKTLECAARTKRAPVVIWAGLDETEERFAERCAAVAPLAGRVIAAVPYGFAVPEGVQAVPFAPKYFPLLHPEAPIRYRIASGGRGSGKSHAFVTAVVLRMLAQRMRILAAREVMKSLRESAAHLLADKIRELKLEAWFEISESEVSCPLTGSEVIFGGLGVNVHSLLSLENVNLVFVEQAETVSRRSLEILVPSIRAPGSEIWAIFNPDSADAPIMQLVGSGRPDVRHVHTTWLDNPYWSGTSLEAERVQMLRTDPERHAHVYGGECNTKSEAIVFSGKWTVEEFTPIYYPPPSYRKAGEPAPWYGPYLGMDFGYAVDPSVLILCYISTPENSSFNRISLTAGSRTLYIEREAYGVGIALDALPALFDQIEGARRHTIRADSSRPETINHLRARGFRGVTPVDKWKGSVEDGIEYMRGFERILIHPRCERTIEEFQKFSYRVDRLTGDVLPDLKPGWDHCVDALRYALAPAIKHRSAARVMPFWDIFGG